VGDSQAKEDVELKLQSIINYVEKLEEICQINNCKNTTVPA